MYSDRNALPCQAFICVYLNVRIRSKNLVGCIISIVNPPLDFSLTFIRNINFLIKVIIVIFEFSNFYFLDVDVATVQMLL